VRRSSNYQFLSHTILEVRFEKWESILFCQKQATISREFEEGSRKINCQERIDLTALELKIIRLQRREL
jgi:hypothetical protein